MKKILVALCSFLAVAAAVSAQRLPRTVIPNHYELTLAPDFETETFRGEEMIRVSISEPTTAIELHAIEIDIDRAVIETGTSVIDATVTYDEERQTATLTVGETVRTGPAVIRIDYHGRLNPDLRGFYLGVANDEKYAATQMEALDARRAFPSFDEPWMKATFDITLVVDDGHRAFSNGAELTDTPGPDPGKHTVHFSTTPRMSTYLVALVVGRFDCLEDEHDGIPLRICATPEKVHLGQFAMDATKATLEYFGDYFDYPYPFGTLDQIGIQDFRAGAMENTGAIIYRESALLYDTELSSVSQQRRVAAVVAHEIAHQWFGDLVTMRWWNDIWLNEGFASFMDDKAVKQWKPEWNIDVAIADGPSWPLASDVLESTRQIRTDGDTPTEIESMFDGIAYGKTSAVLHMIDSYLGEESMRDGIAMYMKRHSYANTTAEDFFEALSDGGGADVGAIMRSFVNQPGVPVVTVDASCDGTTTVVTLEQRRFFVDREEMRSRADQLWRIPVCFDDGSCHVLSKRTQSFELDGCQEAPFANRAGRGYYLTAYSSSLQARLGDRIVELSPAERLVMLRDEWYLVRVGNRSISEYLDLVTALAPTERERRVVDEYLGRLEYVEESLVANEEREAFHGWMQELLQPVAAELGWVPAEGESPETTQLRTNVLMTLGDAGADPGIRARARELADDYLTDRTAVHPSLAGTVLYVGAIESDAALYDRYLEAYKTEKNPETSIRLMYGLTMFEDPALRARNRELAFSDDIRTQDAARFLYSTATDRESIDSLWAFFDERWEDLEERIPPRHIGFLVPRVGGKLCTETDREEIMTFAKEHHVDVVPRSLAAAQEKIGNCLEMKSLHQDELSAYLGRVSPEVMAN